MYYYDTVHQIAMTVPADQHEYRAFFLVGPTASGKTAVSQWIAERHGYEILSADSMLVYRGMDVGTAKPTDDERRRVRYWGVDLVSVSEPFHLGRYLDEARRCFDAARRRNVPVIVTGGTGLYIKALTVGVDDAPVPPDAVRRRLRTLLAEHGVTGLQKALAKRNPAWYAALPDCGNSRRLLRALELVELGWTEPPQLWRDATRPEMVGLAWPREALHARIALRVNTMYQCGLLDETRRLLSEGLVEAPTARHAVGYAEATACLEGRLSLANAMQRTIERTRQLAKRQMTWFRHQATVHWLDAGNTEDVGQLAEQVLAQWAAHGPTSLALTP